MAEFPGRGYRNVDDRNVRLAFSWKPLRIGDDNAWDVEYEADERTCESKGKDFDRLFLSGMIQHHEGALVMVKDLFDTAGAGQDAELFNFASDVDSGQRAEIKIMQTMLGKKN
ncbi:MAG: DUF305 domain-containing protein [Acidobacteria bacterium]|nr:DUF305 domain-containing protein [Acidobacteriota bacterium]